MSSTRRTTLVLSNLVNVLPATVVGTGTITDDDAAPDRRRSRTSSLPEGDAGTTNAIAHRVAIGRLGQADRCGLRERRRDRGRPERLRGRISGTLSFAPGPGLEDRRCRRRTATPTYENDETFIGGAVRTRERDARLDAWAPSRSPTTIRSPQVSIDDRERGRGRLRDHACDVHASRSRTRRRSRSPSTCATADQHRLLARLTTRCRARPRSSFAPGQVSPGRSTVLVLGDTRDEFDETFSVDLSNPVGVAVADRPGVGTIVDDDAAPIVSIDDVSVTEGDAGTTTASFTVSLSAPSGKPIAVDYASAPAPPSPLPTSPASPAPCRSRRGRRRRPSTSTSRVTCWTSSTRRSR